MSFLRNHISLNGNKKKIMSNVAWAMGGKIVNMAGALFVGILVARYLGPEQYGVMNYVISYVSIFTVLSSFGLDNIEIRELSRRPSERDTIMGTCLRIRLVCATIAFLLVGLTLVIYKTDGFTTTMILCYCLTLYTNCFGVVRNYFTSIVKNEYIVKTEISRTVIGAVIKIALLLLKSPLEWFIMASIFDTVLVASGYCLSYRKIIGKISVWKYDKTIVPFFLKESFPLVLSGAAVIIYQRIDQVMIGNMLDKESVGYFATAGKFLDLVLFLPTVLVQTVTPLLVRARENESVEIYNQKKYQFASLVIWISVIVAACVSLLAYWLVYLTYGEAYLMAVPVLQIMAWKTVGMAMSSSAGQIIIMEHLQKWAVIRNVMGCLACVGLNLIFIPQYGMIGSAWVTIITTLVAGYLANILIPPYRHIFRLETKAIFCGWRELNYIKSILKK